MIHEPREQPGVFCSGGLMNSWANVRATKNQRGRDERERAQATNGSTRMWASRWFDAGSALLSRIVTIRFKSRLGVQAFAE